MYALDFEYDGQSLSDFGFIICDFNSSSGADIVSAGSNITFNTVPMHRGRKFGLAGTQYNECIQTVFHVCKDPDSNEDMKISNDEYRELMRWLNRKEFLQFQVLYDDDYDGDACYFDASFNIGKIEINKILYGLELTMNTNRPFGYGDEKRDEWDISEPGQEFKFIDSSDEIGYFYPNVSIVCMSDGDMSITNQTIGRTMTIKNCVQGEIITIQGNEQIITSSVDHALYDDFNFQFLQIGNSYENQINVMTASLPCHVEIWYTPIIKDAP